MKYATASNANARQRLGFEDVDVTGPLQIGASRESDWLLCGSIGRDPNAAENGTVDSTVPFDFQPVSLEVMPMRPDHRIGRRP
jgi:hypothetical protein